MNGPFFLTQRVAKEMRRLISEGKMESGKIVNVSSISAYTSSPNRAAYPISKAALSMVTQEYADRLAREKIFVYEIRPGVIETDMTSTVKGKYEKLIADGLIPIARMGKPEDIGKMVAILAKDDIPYSTGQVFNIDGGFHIRRL